MDTDFHPIFKNTDEKKIRINPAGEIIIGENVWIGCRCLILKNTHIASNTIIAAGSTITKDLNNSHCVYGNNGVILKTNVTWADHL